MYVQSSFFVSLSLYSSGDNTLNLLLKEPKAIGELVGCDLVACLCAVHFLSSVCPHRLCMYSCELCLLCVVPTYVVSVDMSVAQSSLLELKMAAIKHLEYTEFVKLIGVMDASEKERLLVL